MRTYLVFICSFVDYNLYQYQLCILLSQNSGVRPVDKREGAGAHNWGTMQDDLAYASEL